MAIEVPKNETKNLKFKTKNFVLTGSLESMSREQAKEKIRSLGGEISESVSKNTSYVIAGNASGSKIGKSEKIRRKDYRRKRIFESNRRIKNAVSALKRICAFFQLNLDFLKY